MAIINETGFIHHKTDVETGTSKAGKAWSKMTVVIRRENANPNFDKIALTAFGDRCQDVDRMNVGDKVEYSYSVDAREWNGKWFNDVSLYAIKAVGSSPAPAPDAEPFPAFEPVKDDLPF